MSQSVKMVDVPFVDNTIYSFECAVMSNFMNENAISVLLVISPAASKGNSIGEIFNAPTFFGD